MNIQSFFEYSALSNLAYVNWTNYPYFYKEAA